MGPGLLESVYLTCLCYELKKAGLIVEREKKVPLFYEGVRLDQSYRLDLLVQEKVIVEIKAVESITAVHRAQLLSYLKLTGCFAERQPALVQSFEVLTESIDASRPNEIPGHTENFLNVWVQDSSLAPNQIVEVELVANTPEGLIGKRIS